MKGQVGFICNIGHENEQANITIAKDLMKTLGYEDKMDEMIKFVPDRKFNDFRYTINSVKLHKLYIGRDKMEVIIEYF